MKIPPPNPAKTDNGKYKNYPRGFIVYEGEKVHIRFLHYKDGNEAIEKWNRRSRRVNYDRLFVVGSEVDGCTEHDIEQFTNLPYEKKIFFTKYKYTQFGDSKIVMDIPEMGKPNFISLYGMAHLGYKLICRQAKL